MGYPDEIIPALVIWMKRNILRFELDRRLENVGW
jgi:hypothetical protein